MKPSLEEARRLIEEEVAKLRRLSYDELWRFQETVVKEVRGPSGYEYSMEIEAWGDQKRKRTLRVLVSVHAWWGRGTVQPQELMEDFIMAPDGSFVGE